MKLFLTLALCLCFAGTSFAEARKSKVRMQFLKKFGIQHTPPGCQVDHWIPLMCGGPDSLENLRLICGDYKVRKERAERKCHTLPQWIQENPCETNFCLRPQ